MIKTTLSRIFKILSQHFATRTNSNYHNKFVKTKFSFDCVDATEDPVERLAGDRAATDVGPDTLNMNLQSDYYLARY